MITDVFLLLISLIFQLFASILAGLSFLVPNVFETALAQAFGYVAVLQGILPMVPDPSMSGLASEVGILTLFGYTLQFLLVWYSVLLAISVIGATPWFKIHLPNHHKPTHQ